MKPMIILLLPMLIGCNATKLTGDSNVFYEPPPGGDVSDGSSSIDEDFDQEDTDSTQDDTDDTNSEPNDTGLIDTGLIDTGLIDSGVVVDELPTQASGTASELSAEALDGDIALDAASLLAEVEAEKLRVVHFYQASCQQVWTNGSIAFGIDTEDKEILVTYTVDEWEEDNACYFELSYLLDVTSVVAEPLSGEYTLMAGEDMVTVDLTLLQVE